MQKTAGSANLIFKLGQDRASISEVRQPRRKLLTHCPWDDAEFSLMSWWRHSSSVRTHRLHALFHASCVDSMEEHRLRQALLCAVMCCSCRCCSCCYKSCCLPEPSMEEWCGAVPSSREADNEYRQEHQKRQAESDHPADRARNPGMSVLSQSNENWTLARQTWFNCVKPW